MKDEPSRFISETLPLIEDYTHYLVAAAGLSAMIIVESCNKELERLHHSAGCH